MRLAITNFADKNEQSFTRPATEHRGYMPCQEFLSHGQSQT